MKKLLASFALASLVLAAPAAARRDAPDVRLQKLLDGRVAGKPTDCIPAFSNASTEIIDGKAIVYRVGGTLYVNQPRSGASSLDNNDILVTRVFGSRLCRIDTVRLIDRTSGFPSGFVILDKFVPYTKPKKTG